MEKTVDVHRRKRLVLTALKIAIGSSMAVVVAQFFQLQYATSAGIIALLTVQNTRKDTIQLTLERLLSFILCVALIFVCFHYIGRHEWVNYGIYIFSMVMLCHLFGWQNTISVNAVMGTHYLASPNYGLAFAMNELSLILIGTGLALTMNWRMPSNRKVLKEDIRSIEDDMQAVLRELASYLESTRSSDLVWFDLDKLEARLHRGLERAYEQAHNTMYEADLYYVEYMEMRLKQCVMLQTLRSRVQKIRQMPRQSGMISSYLEYVACYVHEKNIPDQQIQELQQVFWQMQKEPLPKTWEEFESRAILYHVMMDLEEFLFVKQRFTDNNKERFENFLSSSDL